MSDTFFGTLGDTGALPEYSVGSGGLDFGMDTTLPTISSYGGLSVSAETTDAGAVSDSSFFDTVWKDIKSIVPATVASKVNVSGNSTLAQAWNAAKAKILGVTASNLAARPDVKAAAKQTTGNAIGNFIVNNWIMIAIAVLGVFGFVIFRKGGR